jgi:hypothetical protein
MTEQERQSVDDIKFKVNRLHTLVFSVTPFYFIFSVGNYNREAVK